MLNTRKDEDHGLSLSGERATDKKVIDIHTHIMGPGDSGKGCRMSREFILSPTFASMLSVLKTAPFDVRDDTIKEILLDAIYTSEQIDYAVILSIDGVYKNARYIESESHLVVPNDYVAEIARTHRRVLFGASMHPYREAKEVIAETMRYIDEGAVLFNWLPSSQQIDPEDDRCIPFYICLAREGIPLLCHMGGEFASRATGFKTYKYSDPKKMARALDIGVKVIAAPCAISYNESNLYDGKHYFTDVIEMLKVSEEKKWEFYVDMSSFSHPSKDVYLESIKMESDTGRINPARLLCGSNFPMPGFDVRFHGKSPDSNEICDHMGGQRSLLDFNFNLLNKFGINDSIFTNAWDVLRKVK